jgi:hypothetical protein
MSASGPDLLDFFSTPKATPAGPAQSPPATTTTAADQRPPRKKREKKKKKDSSSSSDNRNSSDDETLPRRSSASTAAEVPSSGAEESFDFAKGFAAASAAESTEREHAFSDPDQTDSWSSLHREKDSGKGKGSEIQTSTSAALRLQPDSMLYSASKSLDVFSARMNDAVGHAITKINAIDQRHGVSAALRNKDAQWQLTHRLEAASDDLTRKADTLHADAKSKVQELKQKVKQRTASKSSNEGRSRGASLTDTPSRRTSGQFQAVTTDESAASQPNDSEEESPRRPPPVLLPSSSSVAAPIPAPAAAAASGRTSPGLTSFDEIATRSKSSSFSYQPSPAKPRTPNTMPATTLPSVAPPPPLQLQPPPDDSTDLYRTSAPTTPDSSTVPSNRSSRSNSLSFNSLALGDVDLDGRVSPHFALGDSFSPLARDGLLRR